MVRFADFRGAPAGVPLIEVPNHDSPGYSRIVPRAIRLDEATDEEQAAEYRQQNFNVRAKFLTTVYGCPWQEIDHDVAARDIRILKQHYPHLNLDPYSDFTREHVDIISGVAYNTEQMAAFFEPYAQHHFSDPLHLSYARRKFDGVYSFMYVHGVLPSIDRDNLPNYSNMIAQDGLRDPKLIEYMQTGMINDPRMWREIKVAEDFGASCFKWLNNYLRIQFFDLPPQSSRNLWRLKQIFEPLLRRFSEPTLLPIIKRILGFMIGRPLVGFRTSTVLARPVETPFQAKLSWAKGGPPVMDLRAVIYGDPTIPPKFTARGFDARDQHFLYNTTYNPAADADRTHPARAQSAPHTRTEDSSEERASPHRNRHRAARATWRLTASFSAAVADALEAARHPGRK